MTHLGSAPLPAGRRAWIAVLVLVALLGSGATSATGSTASATPTTNVNVVDGGTVNARPPASARTPPPAAIARRWSVAPVATDASDAARGEAGVYDPTADVLHTFYVAPSGAAGPSAGVLVHNAGCGETVGDVLKNKLGSIKRAALPKGSPSWSDIEGMTMEEIRAGAKASEPGYKTILKLLNDSRFNKP